VGLNSESLRILIIANNPLARVGLAALLAEQSGCIIAGQIAAEGDLIALAEDYAADAALWVWDVESETALTALSETQAAGLPIVALVVTIEFAVSVLNAGALGVLPQDSESDTILAALNAVTQGLLVVDASLRPALLRDSDGGSDSPTEELTPRESEVLQLLAQGLANKAIAAQLGISQHTVKFHVNAIMTKFGAQSRTEAVIRATRAGLVIL